MCSMDLRVWAAVWTPHWSVRSGGHALDQEARVTTPAWALLPSTVRPLVLSGLSFSNGKIKTTWDERVFNVPSSVVQTFCDAITHMRAFPWGFPLLFTPIFRVSRLHACCRGSGLRDLCWAQERQYSSNLKYMSGAEGRSHVPHVFGHTVGISATGEAGTSESPGAHAGHSPAAPASSGFPRKQAPYWSWSWSWHPSHPSPRLSIRGCAS